MITLTTLVKVKARVIARIKAKSQEHKNHRKVAPITAANLVSANNSLELVQTPEVEAGDETLKIVNTLFQL